MGVCVQYSMSANGHDASVLQSVIEARRRELGETTRNAAVATAIQIVKSLRANTKVANPDDMNVTVKEASQFYVGWEKVGGNPRRCVRLGSRQGTKISASSFVNLAGRYQKGEAVKAYAVNDIVEGAKEKTKRYIILSQEEEKAREYAVKKHKRRVKRYAGLARFALTVAMMKTSTRNSPDKVNGIITNKGRNVAFKNVTATVYDSGFDDGQVDINIHDALDFAALALKGGAGFVQQAVQNACNATIGMINRKLEQRGGIHDKLAIPFPKE